MNNQYFLTIIGFVILTSLIGITLTNISSESKTVELGWNMFDFGMRIGSFVGLIMLLINGTFIKTKYFKIVQGIISFVIIGALLKIMHWTDYANLIIIVGLIGIAICYFLHFSKKLIKKRLDYLKLLWVIVSYTFTILVFLHLINRDYAEIGNYLLWLIMIDFAITGQKNGTIFKK
jgi:hypothetical protein